MGLKRTLRRVDDAVESAAEGLDRMWFSLLVTVLGLREGNFYSPSWAPDERSRITKVSYPYITYGGFRPMEGHPGWWVEGGKCQQPSLWGFWIEHTFVKHHPIGVDGCTIE